MKSPISYGLIGICGFGSFHRNAIDLLVKEGRAHLQAVADPALASLPNLKQELLDRGVHVYSQYQDLLDSENGLDAVTIAAPIPYHYEIALSCIRRGLYVYLEKPPAPLVEQLADLIQTDTEHRVQVGFQLISSDWLQKIETWISEGKLGQIRSIRSCACWPRQDSYYQRSGWAGKMTFNKRPTFDGPITNALSHLLHCTMRLASGPLDTYEDPVWVKGELYRARPIESYDTACLRGEFGSGVEFSMAVTHATQTEIPFQLHIAGDKGFAHLSNDGRRLESSFGSQDFPEITDTLIKKSHRHFADFVDGTRSRPDVSLADTRGYVLTTNGMLASSGGIHDIPPEWVHTYCESADKGYEVEGLAELVQRSFQTGKQFSELGCPWAVSGTKVLLEAIAPLCVANLLGHAE